MRTVHRRAITQSCDEDEWKNEAPPHSFIWFQAYISLLHNKCQVRSAWAPRLINNLYLFPGRLYRVPKWPNGPTCLTGYAPWADFSFQAYNLAFTTFTWLYYINDLHQRFTKWTEYSLKLPYLQQISGMPIFWCSFLNVILVKWKANGFSYLYMLVMIAPWSC